MPWKGVHPYQTAQGRLGTHVYLDSFPGHLASVDVTGGCMVQLGLLQQSHQATGLRRVTRHREFQSGKQCIRAADLQGKGPQDYRL